MATAVLGHGTAGSDDATASQPDKATLRASAAILEPSARQRRDGNGARRAGRVERHLWREQPRRRWKENRRLALTEARLTRWWGGEGRGDHGEATGRRGNVFLRWRARTTAASLGRQWRAAAVNTALRVGKARGRNGAASAFSRRWPSSGVRTRDVVTLAAHERHAANVA